MFCPSCGKQIADASSFCTYCGVTISDRNDPIAEAPQRTSAPRIPQAYDQQPAARQYPSAQQYPASQQYSEADPYGAAPAPTPSRDAWVDAYRAQKPKRITRTSSHAAPEPAFDMITVCICFALIVLLLFPTLFVSLNAAGTALSFSENVFAAGGLFGPGALGQWRAEAGGGGLLRRSLARGEQSGGWSTW